MKVAVLLSGGVDSSVVLAQLKSDEHDVTAFYLKVWLEDEVAYLGNCPWEEDLNYVRSICNKFNVPLEVVSLQQEYYESVVEYVLTELKAGRTPSSDLFCNRDIKFGVFLGRFGKDFDKVASGHYASIRNGGEKVHLIRGVDPIKDQTYFLARLSQEQLRRSLFLLGPYHKTEVRTLAETYNLPNKDRKDSQGICFLGKIKYHEFIRYNLGEKSGKIVERETGKTLGEHEGYWFYTIGQRQGLGLPGGPWYVVEKNVEQNILYVTHAQQLEHNRKTAFKVGQLHWIADVPVKRELTTKIRHSEHLYPCKIEWDADATLRVVLNGSDPGIAAGQFSVFYDGEECLGSGVIL